MQNAIEQPMIVPIRNAWVQMARGEVALGDQRLVAGDGAALTGEPMLRLAGTTGGEVLVFELA